MKVKAEVKPKSATLTFTQLYNTHKYYNRKKYYPSPAMRKDTKYLHKVLCPLVLHHDGEIEREVPVGQRVNQLTVGYGLRNIVATALAVRC